MFAEVDVFISNYTLVDPDIYQLWTEGYSCKYRLPKLAITHTGDELLIAEMTRLNKNQIKPLYKRFICLFLLFFLTTKFVVRTINLLCGIRF